MSKNKIVPKSLATLPKYAVWGIMESTFLADYKYHIYVSPREHQQNLYLFEIS